MFYIYGGGFVEGNSLDHIYGPEYLLDQEVVIVVPNYRVGPFGTTRTVTILTNWTVLGFLSTQDMVVPGNSGLKDQLLALQWTHENIHLFGGNARKITIFGQSAGSASVTYHLLHTESEGTGPF
jgi:carboxylesterase type B